MRLDCRTSILVNGDTYQEIFAMTHRTALTAMALVLTVTAGVWGQVRIDAREGSIRSTTTRRAWVTDSTRPVAPARAAIYSGRQARSDNQLVRLRTRIPVNIDGATAKSAVSYIADMAGLNLVINWDSLQLAGIDPDTPVRLNFRGIPAQKALEAIFMQVTEENLYLDVDRWIVRVMTREQANRRTVVKIYPVGDLLYDAPNFTEAPEFDLSSIATDDVGGIGVWEETSTEEEPRLPKTEKGERLAEMIAQTIAPDLWFRNGGTVASIRYHNGMLIVRAPKYVHARLGFSPSDRYMSTGAAPVYTTHSAGYSNTGQTRYRSANVRYQRRSTGVAGIGVGSAPTAKVSRY